MRSVVVAFALFVACQSRPRVEAPLAAQPTPSRAPTAKAEARTKPIPEPRPWYACARQGAALRVDLCGDRRLHCEERADAQVADCYRNVWRAATRDNSGPDDLSRLGPRWAFEAANDSKQEGDDGWISPRQFAEQLCTTDLADVPLHACIAELVFGVERLVWMGGFGAGP